MKFDFVSAVVCVCICFSVVPCDGRTRMKSLGNDRSLAGGVECLLTLSKLCRRQLTYWNGFGQYELPEYDSIVRRDSSKRPKETPRNRPILSGDLDRHLAEYMTEKFKISTRQYFEDFRPLAEMINFMMRGVIKCQGRCSLFNIGNSYEGRPMIGMKITSPKQGFRNRPKIWISAGVHAREWITHTSALYIANALIERYSDDSYIRHLVDSYEWYILPCVNPDGYNYTWTTDRLWRKTRSYNPASQCRGTDANRNFDWKWGHVGSSSDPCSNDYRGVEPFSEPESRNMARFIISEAKTSPWLLFLTFHSEGQLVLSPWGYTTNLPKDYEELRRVGEVMTAAISERNKLPFQFGSAANTLYYSSGTSRDWARGVANIKYVYSLELRKSRKKKWLIASDEIIPAGEEVMAGLLAGMKAIEKGQKGRKVENFN